MVPGGPVLSVFATGRVGFVLASEGRLLNSTKPTVTRRPREIRSSLVQSRACTTRASRLSCRRWACREAAMYKVASCCSRRASGVDSACPSFKHSRRGPVAMSELNRLWKCSSRRCADSVRTQAPACEVVGGGVPDCQPRTVELLQLCDECGVGCFAVITSCLFGLLSSVVDFNVCVWVRAKLPGRKTIEKRLNGPV